MHVDKMYREPKANKQWANQHRAAMLSPRGPERGIVSLMRAWLAYADIHQETNGAGIGEDYYTGEYWARIGSELIGMLSCDCGRRLDLGTLDSIIRSALAEEGFNADEL